jgi:predicted negative regulator of RcsB-dependent stress response
MRGYADDHLISWVAVLLLGMGLWYAWSKWQKHLFNVSSRL